jgi:hypothetical protein
VDENTADAIWFDWNRRTKQRWHPRPMWARQVVSWHRGGIRRQQRLRSASPESKCITGWGATQSCNKMYAIICSQENSLLRVDIVTKYIPYAMIQDPGDTSHVRLWAPKSSNHAAGLGTLSLPISPALCLPAQHAAASWLHSGALNCNPGCFLI